MSDERDENPELRIPEGESGIREIASKKEQGTTEEARRAISKARARLIGDL